MTDNSILRSRQRNNAHRRGVLLGMTMAEIMILLLFCLLMLFLLQRYDYQELAKQYEQVSKLIDTIQRNIGSYDDTWQFLSDAGAIAESIGPDAFIEAGKQVEKNPSFPPEDITKAIDLYEQVESSILDADDEVPSPEDLQEKMEQMLTDVADLPETKAENEELEKQNERLDEALKQALEQLEGKGQGLVYPSCFWTEDDKIQYVFHIEFDEETVHLTALPVPGNEEEWERLQFDRITTGDSISINQYLSETKHIFDWSVDNACRFFVRILDRTRAENKSQYKTMKRYIEYHFYTWEPPR